MKKVFITIGLCTLLILLLVACGSTNASATTTENVTQENAIHMNASNFTQPSITIKKGERVTLIDDDMVVPHIISHGTWDNGTAKAFKELGAPEVKELQINGNSSSTIGPFTTAGTFKLYCTIHSGMNLTIIVQ